MSAKQTKRTLLQKFDVAGGKYETLFELAEFAPNEVVERHSHPGIEAGYVLEGECIFEFDEHPEKNGGGIPGAQTGSSDRFL
jgi:quercetin dioxygenase-like cupin family protein